METKQLGAYNSLSLPSQPRPVKPSAALPHGSIFLIVGDVSSSLDMTIPMALALLLGRWTLSVERWAFAIERLQPELTEGP